MARLINCPLYYMELSQNEIDAIVIALGRMSEQDYEKEIEYHKIKDADELSAIGSKLYGFLLKYSTSELNI